MKVLTTYILILSGLLMTEIDGLDVFFFPEHLVKKVSNQIKKTFSLNGFETETAASKSDLYKHDIMYIKVEDNSLVGYAIVTHANGCKLGGCMNPEDTDLESVHEEFYFSTLYDLNGNIANVKVLEYSAQYGYEIGAKSWLKQFIGKKGGDLKVEQEIDGISGATISVHSIVNEINQQQNLLPSIEASRND